MNTQKYKKIIVWSLIGMFGIIALFSSFTTIKAGEVGIKTRFGKIVSTKLDEGMNFKIPFIDKIDKISIKVSKVEIESNGASKDLQDIYMNIAVNYKVLGKEAPNLYRNIGKDYVNVILKPAIQESIKSVTSRYTAEELITERQEVSLKAVEVLQSKIEKYGLVVDNFNITNFNFSAEFNKAIEEKQVAEQQVLKAQQELEKTKIEAQQQIEKAKAEAESLKLQKQEITQDLLKLREIEAQLKAIEKWDGKLPSYMFGDSIPFVDVNK